jgi:hypothetical protein
MSEWPSDKKQALRKTCQETGANKTSAEQVGAQKERIFEHL